MTETEHERLFKFWLSEGYKFRKVRSAEIQADPAKYKQRIRMEYEIIRSIPGYVDYFLMCSDLIRWAKDRGIAVGPGRGSAAGALCCWLLRITEIDPLLYPMLFERFIDPNRTDLPDIDIDFEDERRGEVIQYAQEKYGYDRVANILNFVRYKTKNSLDDIARVYNIPEWKIQRIKDRAPERADGHPRFAETIRDTIDSNDDIAELVAGAPEIEYATYLEGNYRNSSFHPAGIVIAGDNINNYCATYEKQSGKDRGQGIAYDKRDGAYLGLLKVDFLSLRQLSAIRASIEPLGMTIDEFYQIPLDDPKVFELFRRGDVLGLFQFEGYATRRVLKQVQPTKFMDLVDVNALSRPGGDDKAYIRNKNAIAEGRMSLDDLHPILYEHLNWTHGVIVYQEQFLLLLRDLGGFEPKDLNTIRKIISDKKDTALLEEYRQRFVDGAKDHGVDGDPIWHQILAATGYAFNISHAVCYSDTAYRQGWLKVYHPEFYLGQLLKCADDDEGKERRRRLIVEANAKGVKVHPPNLLRSNQNWTLFDGHLFAGFQAVKGIGPKVADKIVAWRDTSDMACREDWRDLLQIPGIGPGKIKTIEDFVYHEDPFGVNRVTNMLRAVSEWIASGEAGSLPMPTHHSNELTDGEYVVFQGVLKSKRFKDTVTERLKYGRQGLTREEILEDLDEPHLLKYATLEVIDEYDEPIRIRVGRKVFPRFKALIESARINQDVILVQGYVSEFGGLGVQVNEMTVINLDEDEE